MKILKQKAKKIMEHKLNPQQVIMYIYWEKISHDFIIQMLTSQQKKVDEGKKGFVTVGIFGTCFQRFRKR
jgi:hypothetical protein